MVTHVMLTPLVASGICCRLCKFVYLSFVRSCVRACVRAYERASLVCKCIYQRENIMSIKLSDLNIQSRLRVLL